MDRGFLSISRTSWPFSSSSLAMERPTEPAPAMATRMSVTVLTRCGRPAEHRRDPLDVRFLGDDVQHVALLQDSADCGQQGLAEPGDERDAGAGRLLERPHLLAEPAVRAGDLGEHHGAGRIAPERFRAFRQQPAQHLVRGPADGRHGGYAEPLIDLGPARVVDARHDTAHVERLAGDARRDHVRVVAAAGGSERVGTLDARLDENITIEADAGDLAAPEARSQLAERPRLLVNDCNRVPLVLDNVGDSRANPPAPHNHDVHGLPFSENDARSRYALPDGPASPERPQRLPLRPVTGA